MPNHSITSCPLCGGGNFQTHLVCRDYFVSHQSFTIAACLGCGFRFTQQPPTDAEMAVYYNSPTYISHTNTQRSIVDKLYHLVRRYMLWRKANGVEAAVRRKCGRLLDIGAGTGYFAHTMTQRGWQVDAVEQSEAARRFAVERFALPMWDGDSLYRLPHHTYHVVTLWHVMEHIAPLSKLWDTLYELLTADGVLVVAVPNSDSYDAHHYRQHWAAYDVPRHRWHFTPATLTRIATAHGFRLVAKRSMPFDAFYIAMLSERYKGARLPFLRGLYCGFIAWLHTWGDSTKSSSITYIFTK